MSWDEITIIGGGPAGMYFGILMKAADAGHQITIYERNGPDDTFGWGVVFSGRTLNNLRAADPASHAEITGDFAAWENVDVAHRDEKISIHGNSFSGIARLRLLKILQRRCEELGIEIKFHTEITDLKSFVSECDLFVGADGVNSTVRQKFADQFKPDLSTRPNKYIWYGTRQLFHGLTLTFRETGEGVFAAHSYKFDTTTSTFIIDCDPQTWAKAGFDEMSDAETRAHLENVFARDLGRASAALEQFEMDQLPAGQERKLVFRQRRIAGRRTAYRTFLDWLGHQVSSGGRHHAGAMFQAQRSSKQSLTPV
jgi:anthraniloyl-CoA monooxygenase